ncbi:hypothetical protein V5O48_014985 [Marasmius crinis-equi]|uniref:Uncharacterized protein n=1 Tax=Marasmius crinis-equi TaxID=585013 RepID=A0ABR3EVT4_9AGAR
MSVIFVDTRRIRLQPIAQALYRLPLLMIPLEDAQHATFQARRPFRVRLRGFGLKGFAKAQGYSITRYNNYKPAPQDGDPLVRSGVEKGWEGAEKNGNGNGKFDVLLATIGRAPSLSFTKGSVITPDNLITQFFLNVLDNTQGLARFFSAAQSHGSLPEITEDANDEQPTEVTDVANGLEDISTNDPVWPPTYTYTPDEITTCPSAFPVPSTQFNTSHILPACPDFSSLVLLPQSASASLADAREIDIDPHTITMKSSPPKSVDKAGLISTKSPSKSSNTTHLLITLVNTKHPDI